MKGESHKPETENAGYYLIPVTYGVPTIQERIYKWRLKVFGPNVPFTKVIWKLKEEIAELESCTTREDEMNEVGDIMITLAGRAEEQGYTLMECADRKFTAVVEKRTKEEQLERDLIREARGLL